MGPDGSGLSSQSPSSFPLVLATAFVLFLALAMAPSAEASIEHTELPSLSHVGAFPHSPCGVATDSAGDLYVSEPESILNKIRVYGPSGGSSVIEFSPTGCNLAVDSLGDIYFASAAGGVKKLAPSAPPPVTGTTTYTESTFPGPAGAAGVAVNQSNNHLYVVENASEKQTITFTGFVTNDTFTLTCKNPTTGTVETTGSIIYAGTAGARATNVAAGLNAKCGAGNFTAAGSGTTVTVTFQGQEAAQDLPSMNCAKVSSAAGACSITSETNGSSRISSYESNGTVLSHTIGTGVSGAAYYGVDVYGANEDVYAVDFAIAHNKSYIFNPAGSSILHEFDGSESGLAFSGMQTATLAVDQSNGNVLVSDIRAHGVVDEFNAAGKFVDQINKPFVNSEPSDIAVDSSATNNGKVYVSSGTTSASVYAYGALEPKKTLATHVTPAAGGTIKCNGAACSPEYGQKSAIALEATANANFVFKKWIAGTGSAISCTGSTSSPCAIELEENSEVTAEFESTGSTLAIIENGTGTGAVECEFNNGGSFGACTSPQPNGTLVKVKATANAGSELTAFSGTGSAASCTIPPPCTFTINANSSVTATFNLIPRTLAIIENGTGTGAVECEFNNGGSFGACTSPQPNGTLVKVKATANAGSELTAFSGTGSAASCTIPPPCTFTINANSSVTATFNLIPRTLAIIENGTGTGAVECEFNNGGSFGACTSPQPNGTLVKVKATANAGSELTAFSGTGSAASCTIPPPCTFTINANSSVTATFNLIPRTLAIIENGTGAGAVECEFNNGGSFGACTSPQPNGTLVKVKATANAGSELTAFSGTGSAASCTIPPPCTFTINANSSVTATFNLIPGEILFDPQFNGTGSGEIKCNGGTCAASYPEGTTVTLTAVPTGGHSTFSGWAVTGSGTVTTPCTGTTSPCEVKFVSPGPVSATATFTQITHTIGITIVGTGSVECKDEGAGSFGPCTGNFNEGHVVKLKETPGSHFSFTGWSEFAGSGAVTTACTGAVTECEVKVDNNVTGKATFTQITHTIGITIVGTGSVECKDEGAGSFGPCTGNFNEGHVVKLKETPGSHFSFTGWSEFAGSGAVTTACTGAVTECEVKVDNNVTGKATFTQITHTIGITIVGTGSVECKDEGAGSFGPCTGNFNEGHVVKLKETPGSHFSFTGWSEFAGSGAVTTACTGAVTECEVKVDNNVTGKATFTQITHTIGITIVGTGSVECKDEGAGSFGPCTGNFNEGHVVKLKETPGSHFSFTGWSEFAGSGAVTTACTGAVTECEVKVDNNVTGKATFTQITHTIGITIVGTGSVECKDEGAGSFGPCTGNFNEGHVVKLKETPGSHFSFTGWSEFAGSGAVTTACTGAVTECEVKVDNNVTGKATFTQITHTIGITIVGTGSVECKDEGAGSFGPCTGNFNEGHVVKLKETPGSHFSFTGWSEFAGSGAVTTACTGAVTECEVKVDNNVTGKATFTQITHTLTVTVTGVGKVNAGSGAIAGCEAAGGVCSGSYGEGSVITLTAVPGVDQKFTGWSGADVGSCDQTGATLTCPVTIPAHNAAIAAGFAPNIHTLAINKAGTGTGSVLCNGGSCASSYLSGTSITLAAVPTAGSNFAGWSGGGCSGTGSCVIALTADSTVTATFTVVPPVVENCETNPALCPIPSTPPPPPAASCVVPKLVGKTLSQAKSALVAAGCKLGKTTKPKAAKGHKLVVKSSSPAAGAKPSDGTVNVKLGPKPQHKARQ